jgi:hypothetical protein
MVAEKERLQRDPGVRLVDDSPPRASLGVRTLERFERVLVDVIAARTVLASERLELIL